MTSEPKPSHERTEDGAEIRAHRSHDCSIESVGSESHADHCSDTDYHLLVQRELAYTVGSGQWAVQGGESHSKSKKRRMRESEVMK